MKIVPDKIIVHHTASPMATTSLLDIDRWHRERDFPKSALGYFVGYHYVIFPDGKIFQTRKEDEEGAHCIGQNFTSVGICLVGNFDLEIPTTAQEVSLGSLLRDIRTRYNISITRIYPHRAFSQTNCPGLRLDNSFGRRCAISAELSAIKKILLWIQSQLAG